MEEILKLQDYLREYEKELSIEWLKYTEKDDDLNLQRVLGAQDALEEVFRYIKGKRVLEWLPK